MDCRQKLIAKETNTHTHANSVHDILKLQQGKNTFHRRNTYSTMILLDPDALRWKLNSHIEDNMSQKFLES
jgi:hypothetical protein